ncbi:glyoxalase [Chromatiales bacterium (ex Bugula neritina AB1)]|nr:glyoxalase [Chromatiales bacterium (ex Bugula neritina AB1)]
MTANYLEHVNVTVKDTHSSAALLCRLFDWHIRWQGKAMEAGYTIHVGSEHSYIALYTQPGVKRSNADSYSTESQINHFGVVVDNLDAIEARVKQEGLTITSHADYEPGRRFYFDTPDGIEIEVISYS